MIKILNKDDDFVLIYSKNISEINYLKKVSKVSMEITYDGYPAIIVRKEKGKAI